MSNVNSSKIVTPPSLGETTSKIQLNYHFAPQMQTLEPILIVSYIIVFFNLGPGVDEEKRKI